MALLNRFSKLNDRAETGIFTFIVTKSVTRDLHRDATTKDFCFGYHRWAVSFQRPSERVLGVHLLLRNPSPNTCCVVDFTLTLLNRQHFALNEVYSKAQAKFTITNPMQGVSRWIQISDLVDRHFSNETGEFLFELSLSNMTTIFECDIQLSPATLSQYKCMLKSGLPASSACMSIPAAQVSSQRTKAQQASQQRVSQQSAGSLSSELINLETNYFTFGAFDWSLTIVPLVMPATLETQTQQHNPNLAELSSSNLSISSGSSSSQQQQNTLTTFEPVCRVYLNRLNGFDCLCRVKYRVILGHHLQSQVNQQQQQGSSSKNQFVDSRMLDQISDSSGRIRGHQFRHTNILKLISIRSPAPGQASGACPSTTSAPPSAVTQPSNSSSASSGSALDLRVHIEMVCANTVSEASVLSERRPNEPQTSNCSDRNKQAWCVESDKEQEALRLKLFFMDLQSVPRNHIRYISWIAYVVRKDPKSSHIKESLPVRSSPHSNYYLQDGIDLGTIMDTDIPVKEITSSSGYLDTNQALTVHIEWVDSLLLFSHLYNSYDALATIQRHQIGRELSSLQLELEELEKKYAHCRATLSQLLADRRESSSNLTNSNNPRQTLREADEYSLDSPDSAELASELLPAKAPDNEYHQRARPIELQQPQQQQQQQQKQQNQHQNHHQRQQQQQQVSQELALLSIHQERQLDYWQPTVPSGSGPSSGSVHSGSSSGIHAHPHPHSHSHPQPSPSHYQSTKAAQSTPMSLDERLKFSSSTPPQQNTTSRPSSGCAELITRRRLPAQPSGLLPNECRRDSVFHTPPLEQQSRRSSAAMDGGSFVVNGQKQQASQNAQPANMYLSGLLEQHSQVLTLGQATQPVNSSMIELEQAAALPVHPQQHNIENQHLHQHQRISLLANQVESQRKLEQVPYQYHHQHHLRHHHHRHQQQQQQQQQQLFINDPLTTGSNLVHSPRPLASANIMERKQPQPSGIGGPQTSQKILLSQEQLPLHELQLTYDTPVNSNPLFDEVTEAYLSSSSLLSTQQPSSISGKIAANTSRSDFSEYHYSSQFNPI